jgi:hypothetical protein
VPGIKIGQTLPKVEGMFQFTEEVPFLFLVAMQNLLESCASVRKKPKSERS